MLRCDRPAGSIPPPYMAAHTITKTRLTTTTITPPELKDNWEGIAARVSSSSSSPPRRTAADCLARFLSLPLQQLQQQQGGADGGKGAASWVEGLAAAVDPQGACMSAYLPWAISCTAAGPTDTSTNDVQNLIQSTYPPPVVQAVVASAWEQVQQRRAEARPKPEAPPSDSPAGAFPVPLSLCVFLPARARPPMLRLGGGTPSHTPPSSFSPPISLFTHT